jgi:hypothetical protein
MIKLVSINAGHHEQEYVHQKAQSFGVMDSFSPFSLHITLNTNPWPNFYMTAL